MFLVAEKLQPERFNANVVVLWDEYGSVVGNALIEQVQQSPPSVLPSSSSSSLSSELILSHLHMVRRLCKVMKDECRTRLFFVTGVARLNLSVQFVIRATLDGVVVFLPYGDFWF